MTPIHLIGSTFCLPIPDRYAQVSIDPVFNELYWWSHEGVETTIPLPHGNWEIICATKECTEEIAKGMVQVISNGKITGLPQYRRYDRDLVKDTPARCWTRDPRHALETLVASKGLNPDKTLIIKKVS